MNKTVLVVIGAMALLLLFGCNKTENIIKTVNDPHTSNSDFTTTLQGDKNTQQEGLTTMSKNRIYSNPKLGFCLEFPQGWDGYYCVENIGENIISINFVGRSKVGQGFVGKTQESNGLPMFYIGKGQAFNDMQVDSKKKIDAVNGSDFYFATSTDYTIDSLDLSTDQAMSKLVEDKNERELMKNDFAKAREMETDINNILKTFKPLK